MICEDKIRGDLKEALKKRDGVRVSVLRLLLSSLQNTAIAKRSPLVDTDVLDVVSREVNRHRESIKAFKQGNRSDLVSQEEAELAILMEYLPKQMSHGEIVAAAQLAIREIGAHGISDKGKVMSQLMPQLKGKAGGKEASDVVTELLAGL